MLQQKEDDKIILNVNKMDDGQQINNMMEEDDNGGEEAHRINKDMAHNLEQLLEHRASADQLMQQNIMHGSM